MLLKWYQCMSTKTHLTMLSSRDVTYIQQFTFGKICDAASCALQLFEVILKFTARNCNSSVKRH